MDEHDEPRQDEPQDAKALDDRTSKYANVRCPVHGVAADFETDADGSVVEHICCEALAQILQELKQRDADEG